MAKARTRKVGIKMMIPGTEWHVNAAIPVYAYESRYKRDPATGRWEYQHFNYTVPFSPVVMRSIAPGLTLRVLDKPQDSYDGKMLIVTILEEPNSVLYLKVKDVVSSVTPGANVNSYRIMHVNGSFYKSLESSYLNGKHAYTINWAPGPDGAQVFAKFESARNEAIRLSGAYLYQPCNVNIANELSWGILDIAGIRYEDLRICRCHILTGDLLEKAPVILA
jgi:hypothetical protein